MKRFRCKTCGNETEFTIWRPVAEYDAATGDFIEELPVIANKV